MTTIIKLITFFQKFIYFIKFTLKVVNYTVNNVFINLIYYQYCMGDSMYNDDYYIGQIIINICNGKVYGPFEVDYVRSEEDFDENFSSWNLEHGYSMLDILDLNTGELHTREDTSSFDADVTENELIKLLFGKGS